MGTILNLPVRWWGGAGYYREVMLRDCTFSTEYPDTVDESLEEGGWLRKIMFRNFEHIIGYTSTSAEFVKICAGCESGQVAE